MRGISISVFLAFLIIFSNLVFAQTEENSYKSYINTEIDKSAKEKRILAEQEIIRNLENVAEEKKLVKKNESDIIERKIMVSNSVKADSKLKLIVKEDLNNSKIGTYLSNGAFIEVKYLPDQASAIALKKVNKNLEGLQSEIELKEIIIENKARIIYEVKAEKNITILGLFATNLKVNAYIDAETGEIVKLEQPWWIALAN